MKEKLISLVVCCYNEQENIQTFYNKIKEVFNEISYPYEIIFVDDGSKDNTYYNLSILNKVDPNVKVVSLSRNFGKEIALSAGLAFAKGNAVIPMDVDLQDPPEVIPQFIKKWEEGYDVVYGIRSKRENEPALKKFFAFLFYKLISGITKINIPQNTGDFRLMDKKVVSEINKLPERHRFMKGLFSWIGFNQVGIYYIRPGRKKGQSKFNFIKLLNLALEGITSFTVAPLRLATLLGIGISIMAFVYGLFVIIRTLEFGNAVPGYSSTLAIILFLGGIQLFTIGIIGEYLGKIFNETKQRPLYVVKNLTGF